MRPAKLKAPRRRGGVARRRSLRLQAVGLVSGNDARKPRLLLPEALFLWLAGGGADHARQSKGVWVEDQHRPSLLVAPAGARLSSGTSSRCRISRGSPLHSSRSAQVCAPGAQRVWRKKANTPLRAVKQCGAPGVLATQVCGIHLVAAARAARRVDRSQSGPPREDSSVAGHPEPRAGPKDTCEGGK